MICYSNFPAQSVKTKEHDQGGFADQDCHSRKWNIS